MLAANWAMSLDVLRHMGPGQVCVVSDDGRHVGRTALHMAVWSKPKDTAEDIYEAFLQDLVRKALANSFFSDLLCLVSTHLEIHTPGPVRRPQPDIFLAGLLPSLASGQQTSGHAPSTSNDLGARQNRDPRVRNSGQPQAKRCLNWYSHQGATALMMAVTQGNTIAVRVLLDAGAGGTSTLAQVAVACMRLR